jgi:hypothetical protein
MRWLEEKQHWQSATYTCDKCKTVFDQYFNCLRHTTNKVCTRPHINFVPNMSTGDILYPHINI